MEGEDFLEQYQGQTVDELIDLEETYRIDSLVLAAEQALDEKRAAGEELTPEEMVILAIEAFEREVNNGGFSQFFYNSSNEYAAIIVDSLRTVGCHHAASLAQQAIDALALDSLDPGLIEERMDPDDEALEASLAELDDEYYDTVDSPAYALFDFMKENRERINLN